MSKWETIDLDVCDNCAYAIANGAGEIDPEYADEGWHAAFDAGVEWETADGWDLVSGDCGDEGEYCYFSYSPCDVCRLPLGGDRHLAHVMRETP